MTHPAPTALVVDWGGVLTVPLTEAFGSWAAREGVAMEVYRDTLREWGAVEPAPDRGTDEVAGGSVGGDLAAGPVAALERGELHRSEFEQQLAAELTRRGVPVQAQGLLDRMLSGLEAPEPRMHALVRAARKAGLRTALLSNSWGNTYDRSGWDEMFEVVVISGEVGMRKPEARIFTHTVEQLGLEPGQCVMIDDLPSNVAGAEAVGMHAVLHREVATTIRTVATLTGADLSAL
jgi:epoxide hydrolase-like predicted phosphatase